MNTWQDVADKFITVALPILFTGAVALFAATRNRRQQQRLDHRNLVVSALERLVRQLADVEFLISRMTTAAIQKRYLHKPLSDEETNEFLSNADQLEKAYIELDRVYLFFGVICTAADHPSYQAYQDATGVVIELCGQKQPPPEFELTTARETQEDRYNTLMHHLRSLYTSL